MGPEIRKAVDADKPAVWQIIRSVIAGVPPSDFILSNASSKLASAGPTHASSILKS